MNPRNQNGLNGRLCDGSGERKSCEARYPHEHCVCGLVKAKGAEYCSLCVLEGLEYTPPPDEGEAVTWTGGYPSFRRNRTRAPHPDNYLALAVAIGTPYYGRGRG